MLEYVSQFNWFSSTERTDLSYNLWSHGEEDINKAETSLVQQLAVVTHCSGKKNQKQKVEQVGMNWRLDFKFFASTSMLAYVSLKG